MKKLLTTASALALLASGAAFAAAPSTMPPNNVAPLPGDPNAASAVNPATPAAGAMAPVPGTTAPGAPAAIVATPSQSGPSTTGSVAPQAGNQTDQDFVIKASQGGKEEIASGQLAMQRAQDLAVKEFGRWMATDHKLADNWLQQIVGKQDVKLPSGPQSDRDQAMNKLWNTKGAEFDRDYIRQEVADHEKTVQLFQHEADSGQNADLKNYAQQLVPVLQAHLEQARELDRELGAHGARASGANH